MEKIEPEVSKPEEEEGISLEEVEECEIIEEGKEKSLESIGDKMELGGEIKIIQDNEIPYSDRIKKVYEKNDEAILDLLKLDNFLVYGGMDDTLTIVDLEQEKILEKKKFEETVNFIRVNCTKTYLAVATLDNMIKIFSIEDFKEVSSFETEGEEVTSMVFHKKGDVLLAGFKDGTIKMYKIPSGKELITFYGHIDEVTSVQFSRNGKLVISSSMDSTIRTFSPKSGMEKARIEGHKFHTEGVLCFTQNPEPKSKTLASGGVDCTVCLSSYDNGKVHMRTEPLTAPVNSISFCLQWKVFLASTLEGELVTYDIHSGEEISKVKEKEGIIQLQFYDHLKYFIASTIDGYIVLHGYGKSGVIKKYKLHETEIHHFYVEGQMMYSCGEDARVCITELPKL